MIARALLVLALLWPLAAPAEEQRVIAALSQNAVSITTDFSGSEIFVYGAIERNRFPDARDDDLDVIIAVIGPSEPIVIRKKSRVLGVWANTEEALIDSAPSFYAIATTGPLSEILSRDADIENRITMESAIRIAGVERGITNPLAYRDAIIRINRDKGVYFDRIGGVKFTGRTLFQTQLELPANIFEGDYAARVFLLRGGEVLDSFQTGIRVRKVGLERWIYTLANENSLIYGLLSILVALLAGWGASEAFRLLRR